MARIAVGGFQHETNTFASTNADFHDFELHDAWPGLTRGPELFDAVAGLNLALESFIRQATDDGHELVPLLWASAEPSSHVTEDAFERIVGMMTDDLARLGPFDAVFLDLHGAMVTAHCEDGEGETLERVRGVVGHSNPVVNSLDLHANITQRMVAMSSAMTIYRTYPHIDMDETGRRCYRLAMRLLSGEPLAKGFARSPFLVPLSAQWTGAAPNNGFYDDIRRREHAGVTSADLALGFPPADIAECGPAALAYDADPHRARETAHGIMTGFISAEDGFDNALLDAGEAVRAAMAEPAGPVVLADAQDNPGAGGTSDTVGILEALVRHHATGAALALLCDPEVAREAHARGEGSTFDAPLGGKSGRPGQSPFRGRFRVERLGNGIFECHGEMYRGVVTNLGPLALLSVADADCDVKVIVSSVRFQNLDQACFRHIGVEPTDQHILVVKSTVHFRADYDPIAARTLIVESPGEHPCRLDHLGYRFLRDGVRLGPGGPEYRRP
ncbi:MAG: M81 family metallopeptidase [Alphaproteobacteria bacterium]|nr:M81 family metallopeptidase [Alphaproteobacteria bacterium]